MRVTCGVCGIHYYQRKNLLSGDMVWFKECPHDYDEARIEEFQEEINCD